MKFFNKTILWFLYVVGMPCEHLVFCCKDWFQKSGIHIQTRSSQLVILIPPSIVDRFPSSPTGYKPTPLHRVGVHYSLLFMIHSFWWMSCYFMSLIFNFWFFLNLHWGLQDLSRDFLFLQSEKVIELICFCIQLVPNKGCLRDI